MLYKFKSPAAGDVIMLEANGNGLLRVLGREPSSKGIIEPADMPAAIAALEKAIAADEALDKGADAAASGGGDAQDDTQGAVGLRQRFWPMLEMLREAMAADEPIVWGV